MRIAPFVVVAAATVVVVVVVESYSRTVVDSARQLDGVALFDALAADRRSYVEAAAVVVVERDEEHDVNDAAVVVVVDGSCLAS